MVFERLRDECKGGVLKLTDFGIAHVADGNGMTVTGQILGSPAHMAPEQIDAGPVDARTDLFSLGTVLYVLAVGRLPFEAPVAHALLRKILEADFTDPVRAEPKMGERFAAIIRRCMARNINDRYPDAASLRCALCEFCAEVGWEEPEKKLVEYFADPEAFTEALKQQLLEVLPERGRRARDAKRVPEAMAYFNRALALDPSNLKVVELVRSVAKRRQRERALRAAGLVSITAVVSAGVVVGAVRALRPGGATVRPDTSSRLAQSLANSAVDASGQGAVSARNDAVDAASTSMPTGAVASMSDDASSARVARPSDVRVRLIVRGTTGQLAIDGAAPRVFESEHEHRFAVGPHEVQLIPNDAQCERPLPWRIDVRAQQNGAIQELTSPTFVCHSATSGAAARTNGNANANANARSGATLVRTGPTAGAENVNVRLIVLGIVGLVSIDGRDAREHDNGNEYPLSPGSHTVQVVPADPSCARPAPWRIDVQPTAEGVPLRLTSPRYGCVTRATALTQPPP